MRVVMTVVMIILMMIMIVIIMTGYLIHINYPLILQARMG